MKVIEVYCGTKSFSKVAESKGHDVFTLDFNPKFNPDLCCDMLYFDKKILPKGWRSPDMLWCSHLVKHLVYLETVCIWDFLQNRRLISVWL